MGVTIVPNCRLESTGRRRRGRKRNSSLQPCSSHTRNPVIKDHSNSVRTGVVSVVVLTARIENEAGAGRHRSCVLQENYPEATVKISVYPRRRAITLSHRN